MRQHDTAGIGESSRRDFLSRSAGFAALAASTGFAPAAASPAAAAGRPLQQEDAPDRITIRSVDAYPVYINQRSEGLLDPPVFDGDDDPRRWRYGGPFEQLPSAIIAIIKTDAGITGFGMGAGGSAAVEIIDGHLKHLLVGTNPLNVDQLWDQMYSSAVLYGRRGIFAMALSAVDTALWDIKGKHAGRSVHALLGGNPDDRVAVYQTGGDIAAGKGLGIRHFKRILPIGPHSTEAETERYIEDVLAARDAMGPEGNLMTDCVSRNGTVDWAVGVADRLRPANLYFMEELLSPDDVFGYAELVEKIGGGGPGWTKVACGEHEYTEHGFEVLVRLGSAEVLQPDITWCGGLTAAKRIADLIEAAGLELVPHRGGSLWGLPISLTAPSCTMAESFATGSTVLDAMQAPFENGDFLAPSEPGFGTGLTEEMVLDHQLRP
ncbi:MAG: mandelate racemase/muconate lactonizing enzyme family protein [Holophagales bacterium]|nr:mandelate racemase/muconate lactonizing enzyme family protein [Holophagales bacterium]MYH25281.1 mandelate racemase/muconate lactonizing enzyme family protein [Holophagales bacterium]